MINDITNSVNTIIAKYLDPQTKIPFNKDNSDINTNIKDGHVNVSININPIYKDNYAQLVTEMKNDLKKINKHVFSIKDVIEKPTAKSAPSNYAIIGRYILPSKIFKILEKQKPGQNGEIHITDSIRTLIHKKNKFFGHIFKGKYLDCGTMKGYIDSSTEISKL